MSLARGDRFHPGAVVVPDEHRLGRFIGLTILVYHQLRRFLGILGPILEDVMGCLIVHTIRLTNQRKIYIILT